MNEFYFPYLFLRNKEAADNSFARGPRKCYERNPLFKKYFKYGTRGTRDFGYFKCENSVPFNRALMEFETEGAWTVRLKRSSSFPQEIIILFEIPGDAAMFKLYGVRAIEMDPIKDCGFMIRQDDESIQLC